jgi:hypothetical protein
MHGEGRHQHAMAATTGKSTTKGTTSVSAFLRTLEHPHTAAIGTLRERILALDPRISDEIKWNAPSFKLDDHFATFRLFPPPTLQLILHTGAKGKSGARAFTIDDPQRLLKWPATDRCILTLAAADGSRAEHDAVIHIVSQWIAQL